MRGSAKQYYRGWEAAAPSAGRPGAAADEAEADADGEQEGPDRAAIPAVLRLGVTPSSGGSGRLRRISTTGTDLDLADDDGASTAMRLV